MTPGRPELVRGLLLGERYALTSRLGSGGMGQVWVARDLRLEREVAVKLVPLRPASAALAGDDGLEAPGAHEARLLAALQHPNIVSVYDVGRTGGWTWIVMELIRGNSLAALLADGPLPVGRAVQLLAQVLEGLQAAHLAGVVHGDVKPSNILVDRAGVGRLVDFGIGRRLSTTTAAGSPGPGVDGDVLPSAVDRVGTLLGTPGYVAPETAALGGASVSGDIWAAGVVLWEAVAGRRAMGVLDDPRVACHPDSVSAAAPSSDGSAVSRLVGGRAELGARPPGEADADPVLAGVAAVVRRAVAPAPEDRFPSAAAMGRALGAVGGIGAVGGGLCSPGEQEGALPELGSGRGAASHLVTVGIAPGAGPESAALATAGGAASGQVDAPPTQAFEGMGAGGRAVARGVGWTSQDGSGDQPTLPAPSGRGAIVAVAIVGVVILVAVVVVVFALFGGGTGRPAADPAHVPPPGAVLSVQGPGQDRSVLDQASRSGFGRVVG